jgi:hypothetical protein
MQDNSLVAVILICAGSCLALLFVAGGGFMIFQSRRSQKKADASQVWPSTRGTIVETKAVRDYHSSLDDDSDVNTYSPRLKYTYRVGDMEYSSDKIAFGYSKNFKSELAALSSIQKYPQGGQVTVYYNPENPNEAVLERKSSLLGWGMVGGVLLMVLGLCSACPMIIVGVIFATGK